MRLPIQRIQVKTNRSLPEEVPQIRSPVPHLCVCVCVSEGSWEGDTREKAEKLVVVGCPVDETILLGNWDAWGCGGSLANEERGRGLYTVDVPSDDHRADPEEHRGRTRRGFWRCMEAVVMTHTPPSLNLNIWKRGEPFERITRVKSTPSIFIPLWFWDRFKSYVWLCQTSIFFSSMLISVWHIWL